MNILCPKKASQLKRQVECVSKMVRNNYSKVTIIFFSEPQDPPKVKYTIFKQKHHPKVKYSKTFMVKQTQHETPNLNWRRHQKKCHRGKPVNKYVDGQVATQSVYSH